MGGLGLTLITGPANAGKVALLLRRYLDALVREPVLIVPNRSDVDRAELVGRELDAWGGEPVFAYGFEDLTGAEWSLLQALAGRTDVTVSIPYEPGRPAFASLARTIDDLAELADGGIEQLPPRFHDVAEPAIAYLERALFADRAFDDPPPLD